MSYSSHCLINQFSVGITYFHSGATGQHLTLGLYACFLLWTVSDTSDGGLGVSTGTLYSVKLRNGEKSMLIQAPLISGRWANR